MWVKTHARNNLKKVALLRFLILGRSSKKKNYTNDLPHFKYTILDLRCLRIVQKAVLLGRAQPHDSIYISISHDIQTHKL